MIKKYKKGNEIVEGVHYDSYTVIDEIEKWSKGKIEYAVGCNSSLICKNSKYNEYINFGDYIIRDNKGVFHSFKPNDFEKIYKEV